jgi:hypothetical protein
VRLFEMKYRVLTPGGEGDYLDVDTAAQVDALLARGVGYCRGALIGKASERPRASASRGETFFTGTDAYTSTGLVWLDVHGQPVAELH